MTERDAVQNGRTYLGIELGSTRIKAVLIDSAFRTLAAGSHTWENRLENGYWTYSEAEILSGLQACFAALQNTVRLTYGVPLETLGGIGISAMMHGYLAQGADGRLLVPFRTWRNTTTAAAAEELSELFGFNIPQRWSVAHLYQAVLGGEPHVPDIRRIQTLAGYIHEKLTGEFVLGVGDASGMFPVDSATCDYDAHMLDLFSARAKEKGVAWNIRNLLPRVLTAGAPAGVLTEEGALLLDPTGTLRAGVPFCPPEGDAGTGMTATNSVRPRTGNVSAGTSVFAMSVLERPLSKRYPEVDIVATPSGAPVAMVHCNNCSGEIDAWVRVFGEASALLGGTADVSVLYERLFSAALSGERDAGGLVAYNYLSGEPVTGFEEGRPLLARAEGARLTLGNLMRAELYAALATLRIGMEILSREGVALDSMTGHGGFFKVDTVGQTVMSAALCVPVTVLSTAGEGGPWGMALLAAYACLRQDGEELSDFLDRCVFDKNVGRTLSASDEDKAGFAAFMDRYTAGLPVERAATEHI